MAQARELVLAADDLRSSGRQARAGGDEGVLRVGLGSGPGAMLMTPLLLKMAQERPRLRLDIARASTDRLVQALRERQLDALVVDTRSLRPAPDLNAQFVHEMTGAFMVRPGHPLARRRRRITFEDLLGYPLASTPLSDEVARVLVERYGPAAHPSACVTLRCEEVPSLVDVARRSDTVLLAVRAAASDLVELRLQPPLDATARFGLVTLRRRTAPPGVDTLRELMQQCLQDGPLGKARAPGPARAREIAQGPS